MSSTRFSGRKGISFYTTALIALFAGVVMAGAGAADGPKTITPAAVKKVKHATAYLKVTLADGSVAEGSGFFGMQPGIVLTNAHVLGMLQPESRQPRKIEVVSNSGTKTERIFPARLLGVDRSSDLAVLRVEGDKLPEPLSVQSAKDLVELDKVYVFGFPFGQGLGKNITVSESSVSSLRQDKFGHLEKIQVNGGMHPGNSGGPVVDGSGQVIGVAVSGIRGTQIHFAMPGDFVHVILRGRVLQATIHQPIRNTDDKVTVRYSMDLLDPLQSIKEAGVEYWQGAPGAGRPPSVKQPEPQAGDGPRTVLKLNRSKDEVKGEIPLPKLEAGKVLWTQPYYVDGKGVKRWVAASPKTFMPPIDLEPVVLNIKHEMAQRPLLLKTNARLKMFVEGQEAALSSHLEVPMMEKVQPMPPGARVQLFYGAAKHSVQLNGKPIGKDPLVDQLKTITSELQVDEKGNFGQHRLNLARVHPRLRADMADFHDQIAQALEMINLAIPNREVKPDETWKTDRPLALFTSTKSDKGIMEITCTYQGVRTRNNRSEAIINLKGEVRGRPGQEFTFGGKAQGQAWFDLEAGQVTQIAVAVMVDINKKLPGGKSFIAYGSFDASLVRQSVVNTQKVATSKDILRHNGNLLATDPFDRVRNQSYHQVHKVKLTAGVTYVIDMSAPPKGLDPFLRLEDATGKQLAFDDDSGGGLNARIVFRCPADGEYRIITTTFPARQTGGYLLTVRE